MKYNLKHRFYAVILAIMLSLTTVPAMAIDSPLQKDSVSVGDAIEALYMLDGEPQMIKQIQKSRDNTFATYEKSAETWSEAYDILPEEAEFNDSITQGEFAEILYNYARHHDVDMTGYDYSASYNAISWAESCGLMVNVVPMMPVTTDDLANTLAQYQETSFSTVGVVSDGLTLLYPTETLTTINPLCDFYVIGDIDESIKVPDNSKLSIQLVDRSGDIVREVYTDTKNNWEGMYVDYPDLMLFTDREEFRQSMMPDLVYDPADISTFGNVWIKACYSDTHYTGVVYGGGYHQDINPVDQYGQTLQPIPEGDYTLEVNLTSEDKSVASLSTQITIGAVPQKVLSRFSPTHYFDKMKAYADDLGYAIYSDPYPGNWNTGKYMSGWHENFRGYINNRWRLVDRLGYIGGMTYFFDYNISDTSTSYTVELGQLGYDKKLTDENSLTYVYFDIGEPEIKQHGKVYEGKFVQRDMNYMNMRPLIFTRADHSTIRTPENVINPTILSETTSEFISEKDDFVANPGEIISVNGLCQVIQPETVILNSNETFTMENRITSIRYTLEYATGELYEVVKKDVPGLERTFESGDTSTSILEFRHNFDVKEEMRGNHVRIFAQAVDKDGNDVGGIIYVCTFKVPRK